MTMVQGFKQFFTPQKYSQIMISELSELSPSRVVDLVTGEGSLLKEVMTQLGDIKYFGNDINQNCCRRVRKEYHHIECFNKAIFLDSSMK
jgi:ubiquinone/menaquinone biosynthesis C-methylase UbiE